MILLIVFLYSGLLGRLLYRYIDILKFLELENEYFEVFELDWIGSLDLRENSTQQTRRRESTLALSKQTPKNQSKILKNASDIQFLKHSNLWFLLWNSRVLEQTKYLPHRDYSSTIHHRWDFKATTQELSQKYHVSVLQNRIKQNFSLLHLSYNHQREN